MKCHRLDIDNKFLNLYQDNYSLSIMVDEIRYFEVSNEQNE